MNDQPPRRIIFLRHGIAEPKGEPAQDDRRRLTAKGRRRIRNQRRALTLLAPEVNLIISSPALRSLQTAELIARRGSRIEVSEMLRKESSAKELIAWAAGLEESAILVGHEPQLSQALQILLHARSPEPFILKKGGCASVLLDGSKPPFLEWLVTPRILRRLSAR